MGYSRNTIINIAAGKKNNVERVLFLKFIINPPFYKNSESILLRRGLYPSIIFINR
jgi:hypothetical protein